MFFIVSFLFMSLIFGYVEWRFVALLAWPMWAKGIISLCLLPALFNLWVILFYGDVVPNWVSKLFSGSMVLLVFLFTATFLTDMFRLITPVSNIIPKLVFFLCIGLTIFSVWNASLLPMVKKVEIKSSLWAAQKPLKIVQLTDFHIGQGFDGKWLEQVIEKTNRLNPDLIVITGDLIDKSPVELGDEMRKLLSLKAPLGVYIVFGNHEAYHQGALWREFFKNMGLAVLKNENISLDFEGQKIALGGIDFGANYQEKKADELLKKTFAGSDEQDMRILLAHHPHVFKKATKHNIFLQLSGHTHGGMIFPVDLIVKLSNKGFLRGLYKKGDSYLYVSNGTGLWGGFPARFGSFNEITLIEIFGK